MSKYSVNELAKLADISIRTLHHYDKIGLLNPAVRSDKMYRWYGDNEVLRLQQILFYKEIGFSLKEISEILNDRNFEVERALLEHKQSLEKKKDRILMLLNTIDKTILKLKDKKMITDKELYEGFSNEEAKNRRNAAVKQFGREKVEASEKYLKRRSKEEFAKLKIEQNKILMNLLKLSKEPFESEIVQLEIAKHYQNTRKFWGTHGDVNSQKKQYIGLGNLYLSDNTYIQEQIDENQDFGNFIADAMKQYAKSQL